MKKLLVALALVFAVFALFGEKPKFDVIKPAKPLAVKNMPAFVEQKLPAVISLKSPLFKGEIQNSNTISGISIHRVSWVYNGLPVVGKFTVIKEKDGKIFNIINGLRDFSLDTKPAMTTEQAALTLKGKQSGEKPDFAAKLVIIEDSGNYRLAYRIRFRPISPVDGRYFYVDANNGRLLRTGNLVKFASNKAKVFDMNPISTPDPIEVDLPWVGDDADGFLSAAADENGLRKIVAANCPDEGATFSYGGQFEFPVCTVKQIANKEQNGSFIYEDWANGLDYQLDFDDVYSEVALYYHMTKIYNYLAGLGLKEYTELPNHKGENPIVGIANFQMMGYYSGYNTTDLKPMDNAFFSKYDPSFADMFYGDFEYSQSDALVFGQGSSADFSYDGDVVYHEFGHGVVDGIAQLAYEGWLDKYGFTNEIMGMNEGMADVFSFIITEDPCLAEYVAKGVGRMGGAVTLDGKLCLRTTTNPNKVNEDFNGESHNDGLPLVGAHWELYQKMLENGFTRDDFAKIFLTALVSVPHSEIGYKEWGELMLEAAASSPASALKDDFEKILTDRGYFEEIRARNVMNPSDYFYLGGVGDGYYSASTATTHIENEDGDIEEVSPMYVQLYYDVPECVDTLTITGTPVDESGSQSQRNAPKLTALVREDKPVIWTIDYPSTVKYDYIVESEERGTWVFSNLEPGKRYYIDFINKGPAGLLYAPKAKASWNSDEECTPTEPEPGENDDEEAVSDADEEMPETGDDDTYSDDEPKKEKKSSGCSMTVF